LGNYPSILTLVQPTDGGILGSYVCPCCWGVLHKVRHLHLIRGVHTGVPVRDNTHPWLTSPKLLTEGTILRVGVSTAVRVMEANVEEEWPETCHTHSQMYNSWKPM